MTVEYAEYLAANVLNEQQLVCSDHSHPTSVKANTHVGELPLSEQSLEDPCQPGKAVRYHIPCMFVITAKQVAGCSSNSTRSRTQRDQALSTLPTSSLEHACRQSHNNRTMQNLKITKMQLCKVVRPYRTALHHKLPKTMPSLHPYDPSSL
jgi:hypothetical protein